MLYPPELRAPPFVFANYAAPALEGAPLPLGSIVPKLPRAFERADKG